MTRIEPDLCRTVTRLTVADFDLLVRLKGFKTERMNAAVFALRRYENASLRYTGIDSHEGLTHIGGYNTVMAKEFEDGKGKPDPFLRAAAKRALGRAEW